MLFKTLCLVVGALRVYVVVALHPTNGAFQPHLGCSPPFSNPVVPSGVFKLGGLCKLPGYCVNRDHKPLDNPIVLVAVVGFNTRCAGF